MLVHERQPHEGALWKSTHSARYVLKIQVYCCWIRRDMDAGLGFRRRCGRSEKRRRLQKSNLIAKIIIICWRESVRVGGTEGGGRRASARQGSSRRAGCCMRQGMGGQLWAAAGLAVGAVCSTPTRGVREGGHPRQGHGGIAVWHSLGTRGCCPVAFRQQLNTYYQYFLPASVHWGKNVSFYKG